MFYATMCIIPTSLILIGIVHLIEQLRDRNTNG